MKMKCLVTGATGYIGKELVNKLLEKDHKVTIISRNAKLVSRKKIKIILADIRDKKSIKNKIKDVDVVYHLAAKSGNLRNEKEFLTTNVMGTKNLIEECIKSQVKYFVYFSTLAIFDEVINTNEIVKIKANPDSFYSKSKYLGEKICNRYKDRIKLLIIRFPMVYDFSEPNKEIKILRNFIKFRIIPIIGLGNNKFNIISRENLIEKVYNLTKNQETDIKNISDKIVKYNDFIEIMKTETKKKKFIRIHVPLFVVKLLVKVYEPMSYLFKHSPLFTVKRIERIKNSIH